MPFLSYLNRYASIWIKFQLKPSVLNPNRDIYATTEFGLRKNREMAGVDDLVVYMQSAVKYSSLYIHHQIVHTSHSPIFSKLKPGGGVYLWGPNEKGLPDGQKADGIKVTLMIGGWGTVVAVLYPFGLVWLSLGRL